MLQLIGLIENMLVTWSFIKKNILQSFLGVKMGGDSPICKKNCIYKLWNNFSKMFLNIKLKPLNIKHRLYLYYNIIIERVSHSGEISAWQCWKSILGAVIWVMSSVMSSKPQKTSACRADEADFGPCCKSLSVTWPVQFSVIRWTPSNLFLTLMFNGVMGVFSGSQPPSASYNWCLSSH